MLLGGALLGFLVSVVLVFLGAGAPGAPAAQLATPTATPTATISKVMATLTVTRTIATATPTPTPMPARVPPTATPTPVPPTPTLTPTPTPSQAVLAGRIGDYVWYDRNRDGLQDSDEPGVHNIPVRLFAGDNLVGTTKTDDNGIYGFPVVGPGTYLLEFVAPEANGFTLRDVGSDDEIDSDADPTTGRTIEFGYEAGDNQMKWDAGLLYCMSCHPPTRTPTPTPTPTATPTRWHVITPGTCEVKATFSEGQGPCGYPETFETLLEITVSEDSVTFFQPSTGDRVSGPINPDGSLTARSETEEYSGKLKKLNGDCWCEGDYYSYMGDCGLFEYRKWGCEPISNE